MPKENKNTPKQHDLQDFMDAAALQIQSEYRRISRRSKEDSGTAGDESENDWAEIFKGWLPPSLQVVTKGRILAADGSSSPQFDVIILHPAYPKKLIPEKQYLAGGVLAAFECKLTLRRKDFPKIAKNSKSLRALVAKRPESPYEILHSPIIYGVLAHSSDWSNSDRSKVNLDPIDKLLQGMQDENDDPRNALDVICIADLACWTRFIATLLPSKMPEEVWAQFRERYDWPTDGVIQDKYIRWEKRANKPDEPPNPIYILIAKLLRRLAWEIPDFRSLASYWDLAKMPGKDGGGGIARPWPLDILGDEVAQEVRDGYRMNGSSWHPWSMIFS